MNIASNSAFSKITSNVIHTDPLGFATSEHMGSEILEDLELVITTQVAFKFMYNSTQGLHIGLPNIRMDRMEGFGLISAPGSVDTILPGMTDVLNELIIKLGMTAGTLTTLQNGQHPTNN